MNLCVGSLNAWGTLSLYIVSYFHLTDSDASLSLFFIVFPLWCLCDGPGIYLADLLYRRFGVKVTTAVAGVVFSAGYFVASYVHNSLVFLLVFGVVAGVGEGITLMTPIWNSWKSFPALKGRISGLLLLGYGCGSPIFGIVFTLLVNPHNDPATEHVREGQASYYLFSSAVAENVPAVMRMMAFIFLALYTVAALLQTDAPAATDAPPVTKAPVKAALRSRAFWQLLVALSLSRSFPIYLLNTYKALGQKFYSDDYFLSTLGSVMMTSSAVGRFALPFAADYLSFQKLLAVSLLGQAVFGATLWFVAAWEATFALWLSMIVLVSGGYLSLFAMETSAVFGSELGPRVFSFVSQGFTVASLIALFVFSYVAPAYGYEVSFWLFAVLLLASLALVLVPMKRFVPEPLLSAS